MTNPNDVPRLKHIDSILQKVNVLGTTPQTVDGGLWLDSNEMKVFADNNVYQAKLSLATSILTDGIFDIDGVYFKLTGFVDGLTIDFININKNGCPITFMSKLVGYLKVSGDNYEFNFFDKDVLADSLADNATISVTQVDSSGNTITSTPVTCTLDLSGMTGLTVVGASDQDPTSGGTGTWRKTTQEQDGVAYDECIYAYTTNTNFDFAKKVDGSDTSYTYHKKTDGKQNTYYMYFTDSHLECTDTTDENYIGNYTTIKETFDSSGNVNVVCIITKAAVEKGTNGELLDNSYQGNYLFNEDSTTFYKTILADDAKENYHDATFTSNNDGTYTFKLPSITEGFVEVSDMVVYWDGTSSEAVDGSAVDKGGETFTISGLPDDLKVYYNADYKENGVSKPRYELYKLSDLVEVDGVTKPKSDATLLVTIDATKSTAEEENNTYKSGGTFVTIMDITAFRGLTKRENTSAETDAVTITVDDTTWDKASYVIALSDKLEKDKGETTDASFTETSDGVYTYKPEVTGWHFEHEFTRHSQEQYTSSYTYKPTATPTFDAKRTFASQQDNINALPEFTINGLKAGLGTLTFVENSDISTSWHYPFYIKSGNIELGRIAGIFDGNYGSSKVTGYTIELRADALPVNPTENSTITISTTDTDFTYALGLDYMAWMGEGDHISRTNSTAILLWKSDGITYATQGTTAGYKLETNGELKYYTSNGGQRFKLTGVYSQSYTGLDINGNIVRVTTLDNNNRITADAYNALTDEQKAGYVFNLYNGLDDDRPYLPATNPVTVATIIARVGTPTVIKLNDTAFNPNNSLSQTITLKSLDGITYLLEYTLPTGAKTSAEDAAITEDFTYESGTYTYTASGTGNYYDTSTPNTIKYVAQKGGQKFTISGLKENLTLADFKNAATFIKVNNSDCYVMLTNPTILSGTMADVVLTDLSDTANYLRYMLVFGSAFYS